MMNEMRYCEWDLNRIESKEERRARMRVNVGLDWKARSNQDESRRGADALALYISSNLPPPFPSNHPSLLTQVLKYYPFFLRPPLAYVFVFPLRSRVRTEC